MVCSCLYWFRFTSTRGGKPIDTGSCLCPRSCKTVRGGRALFPARGWSCSLCCASKLVTTWPLSSMATQIPPGSSSTAWLTVTVGVTAFGCCVCYDIKSIVEMKLWCTGNSFCNSGKRISQGLVDADGVIRPQKPSEEYTILITTKKTFILNQSLWFIILYCIVRLIQCDYLFTLSNVTLANMHCCKFSSNLTWTKIRAATIDYFHSS